jgi:hypothetical protein
MNMQNGTKHSIKLLSSDDTLFVSVHGANLSGQAGHGRFQFRQMGPRFIFDENNYRRAAHMLCTDEKKNQG